MTKNLTTSFLVFIILIFFNSCFFNQDYAYNEKITSAFYGCKEQLDEHYSKLQSGNFDLKSSEKTPYQLALKNVKKISTNCAETKITVNQLTHSELANVFHENIISYISKIETEYMPLIEKYITEQDTETRKSIKTSIYNKKVELSELENKCLGSQIQFLQKAGIKINESSAP